VQFCTEVGDCALHQRGNVANFMEIREVKHPDNKHDF